MISWFLAEVLCRMDGHEQFRELCAASLAGGLTCEERARLAEHLETCRSCRTLLNQYRTTVGSVVPRLAPEVRSLEPAVESSWNAKDAESRLFDRLKLQERGERLPQVPKEAVPVFDPPVGYGAPPIRWTESRMLAAAVIVLFLTLAIASYRLGAQAGSRNRAAALASSNGPARILPGDQHRRLLAELAERDKTISELRQAVASKGAGEGKERTAPAASAISGKLRIPSRTEPVTRSTGSISAGVRVAELEQQIAETQRTSREEAGRTAALEEKAGQLEDQLRAREETLAGERSSIADAMRFIQERDKTIEEQQELLAHDRDIRELMGSRNLYIAEVYDVAKTGQTSKPFGRVFYTKGKSLIFYAYDLDQQPSVKAANSFQVWGREGANQGKTVSLGVFFEDNIANKRWMLKSEDQQSLEQIDAVFVTVEPNGGSPKPTGKPLLFASLRTAPNHP